MPSPRIRPARESDIPDLGVIEVAAGQLFRTVEMAEIAGHDPDEAGLREAHGRGMVWVAELDGVTVGYVVARVLDGNAHVQQVSVDPAHARRGIGRELMAHVETWGARGERPATTLTTFRDVAWNGPYYRRLGYRELSPAEHGPQLADVMRGEAALPGIDASRRCAMIKLNRPAPDAAVSGNGRGAP